MGPKKGKGKGNPVVDGVDTSSMTREQLEAFAHRLKGEMDREREERNFFQLERDKLRTFWEITRNQLEEARAQIRNKEREVEVAQDLADIEIKNVTQQMKHLQYENQTKVGEMRAEMMTQLKIAQENHAMQEQELLNDKRELKRLLREKEENTELQIQEMKMHQTEKLSEERQKFCVESQEIIKLYDKRMETYIAEAETRHHMEINEMEERKNSQLARLIEHHDKSFNDLRNYYNDITQNNLALISSMKDQIEEMRQAGERNKRIVSDITMENKKLLEPMKEAQYKANELKKDLVNYERDKLNLNRLKVRFSNLMKQLDGVRWECESLKMQCEKLTEENMDLKSKFEKAVLELQQKTGLKNSLLERKLEHMEKESEKREAILGEVLNLAGIEPQSFSIRIEKLVSEKNEKIADLRYELARVTKAHDDLLKTMEVKMHEFGIPIDELGFRPFCIVQNIKLGTGPAGLVSKK